MGAKGSVLKRVRQSIKANSRNKHYKSLMKTAFKNALNSTKEDSDSKSKLAISAIDKIQSKGIIHKNAANRLKSRLMKHINNL